MTLPTFSGSIKTSGPLADRPRPGTCDGDRGIAGVARATALGEVLFDAHLLTADALKAARRSAYAIGDPSGERMETRREDGSTANRRWMTVPAPPLCGRMPTRGTSGRIMLLPPPLSRGSRGSAPACGKRPFLMGPHLDPPAAAGLEPWLTCGWPPEARASLRPGASELPDGVTAAPFNTRFPALRGRLGQRDQCC
jgi:hypothetical protein